PYVGVPFRYTQNTVNEVELLITVRPELAEPMDCDQVPPLGPAMSTTVPDNCGLYWHGYTEVPVDGDALKPQGPPGTGGGPFNGPGPFGGPTSYDEQKPGPGPGPDGPQRQQNPFGSRMPEAGGETLPPGQSVGPNPGQGAARRP